jgi:protein-L-isoaspartate(D-aspartate) O-methyltransferase
MDIEKARFNMVEQQVRPWEVLNPEVLDTLMRVPRERFVPSKWRALAFSEADIPISDKAIPSQVMLRPVIEGKVLQAVRPTADERVLEIGTGSGYFAALLAHSAQWVRSIEIDPVLVDVAATNLDAAGVFNVLVEQGDGALGWTQGGPFDVIVVSGGLPVLPDALLAQLTPGARLFAFVGSPPLMKARLVRCVSQGCFQTVDLFETCVPLLESALSPSSFHF